MLSRLVIIFLPRSKRLLISWLQSPSAVIWGELGARGEGDHRGWDGWMASPTLWTWVWVNSLSWWWTWRPTAAAAAKLLQSCPTLHNPRDGSPPGSPIPGILQARTLEWVTISFSNAWKWKVKLKSLSRVRLLATSWTAAYQAPPSMVFSRQEYWRGVPLPSPLACCNSWGHKELDTTERLHWTELKVPSAMLRFELMRNILRAKVSWFLAVKEGSYK